MAETIHTTSPTLTKMKMKSFQIEVHCIRPGTATSFNWRASKLNKSIKQLSKQSIKLRICRMQYFNHIKLWFAWKSRRVGSTWLTRKYMLHWHIYHLLLPDTSFSLSVLFTLSPTVHTLVFLSLSAWMWCCLVWFYPHPFTHPQRSHQ